MYTEEKKFIDAGKEYDQIFQLEARKHGPQDQRTMQAALDLANTYLQLPETTADAVDTLKPIADSAEKAKDGGASIPLIVPIMETYAKALHLRKKPGSAELGDKIQARAEELKKAVGAQGDSEKKPGGDDTAGGAKKSAEKTEPAAKDEATKEAKETKDSSGKATK